MGCVRSKEDKSPTLKYRPENPNATPSNAHLGHYGPDPTLMGHSPAMKTHNNSYNSHTAALTPFGGASSVMTPFGGASTSFTSVAVSSPFPSVITGWFQIQFLSREGKKRSNNTNAVLPSLTTLIKYFTKLNTLKVISLF